MFNDPVIVALTMVGTVVTTIVSVVALGLRAIVRGQLIPGATHDRIVNDKDAQITTWKAAYDKVSAQRDSLLVLGHTTVKAVTSVAEAATAATKGGDT